LRLIFSRPKAARLLALLATVCLLISCGNKEDPEALLADYLQRLNNVNEESVEAADAGTTQPYPRKRLLHLPLGEIRIGMLEFLDLDRCGLETLVGERNSGLGKVMPPSRRLVYEQTFLRLARTCRDSGDAEHNSRWQQIVNQKEQDLPRAWWNATWGGEEFRHLFSGATAPLPLSATQAPSTAVTAALHYLNGQGARLFDGALVPQELETQLQQLEIDAYADRLLYKADLLTRYLEAAAASLERRQARRPVCLNGTPTPRGHTLHTVFTKFYVGAVQPYMASVHRRGTRFWDALDQLLSTQNVGQPDAFTAYYRQRLDRNNPDAPWHRFTVALDRHTQAWQQVLDHCGLRPGQ
jgi:hypothetical protein